MLLSIVAGCWLGAYLLSPCDPVTADIARDYSSYAYSIPAKHLALVTALYRTPDGRGESWYQTGRVGLPRKANLHALSHEVGHLVSFRGGLVECYRARFWPAGVQVGSVPSSYARTNVYEDFAEAYSHLLMADTHDMPDRAAWMLATLPELRR